MTLIAFPMKETITATDNQLKRVFRSGLTSTWDFRGPPKPAAVLLAGKGFPPGPLLFEGSATGDAVMMLFAVKAIKKNTSKTTG